MNESWSDDGPMYIHSASGPELAYDMLAAHWHPVILGATHILLMGMVVAALCHLGSRSRRDAAMLCAGIGMLEVMVLVWKAVPDLLDAMSTQPHLRPGERLATPHWVQFDIAVAALVLILTLQVAGQLAVRLNRRSATAR